MTFQKLHCALTAAACAGIVICSAALSYADGFKMNDFKALDFNLKFSDFKMNDFKMSDFSVSGTKDGEDGYKVSIKSKSVVNSLPKSTKGQVKAKKSPDRISK